MEGRRQLRQGLHIPNVDTATTSLIVRAVREARSPLRKPLLARGHLFGMGYIDDNGASLRRLIAFVEVETGNQDFSPIDQLTSSLNLRVADHSAVGLFELV